MSSLDRQTDRANSARGRESREVISGKSGHSPRRFIGVLVRIAKSVAKRGSF